MSLDTLLPLLFLLIAIFYSSVGFGGGSSYLAILSIFLTSFQEIRSIALLLNLTVVSIGTFLYIRHKVFDWRSFWPFLVASIPFAYFGAQLRLSEKLFFILLGSLLLLSGVSMIFKFFATLLKTREFGLMQRLGIGSFIGFFSGISGIGGGIYLSPLLNLMGWKDARKIASLSSVFILVNSLAGIAGLLVAGTFVIDINFTLRLLCAVMIGGLIGSYLSNRAFNTKYLGLLTAFLVVYVGLKLILLHGFSVVI